MVRWLGARPRLSCGGQHQPRGVGNYYFSVLPISCETCRLVQSRSEGPFIRKALVGNAPPGVGGGYQGGQGCKRGKWSPNPTRAGSRRPMMLDTVHDWRRVTPVALPHQPWAFPYRRPPVARRNVTALICPRPSSLQHQPWVGPVSILPAQPHPVARPNHAAICFGKYTSTPSFGPSPPFPSPPPLSSSPSLSFCVCSPPSLRCLPGLRSPSCPFQPQFFLQVVVPSRLPSPG